MSTSTLLKGKSDSVAEIEIFRHSARTVDAIVRRNAGGVTEAESLIQPQPAGNCMNWLMGHLLNVQERALQLLGEAPVIGTEALKRYERGTLPLTDGAEAIAFFELVTAWEEASKRVDAGLSRLTEEALDAKAPFSPTGNPDETVRSLITLILFHQAYHCGQMGILRRIAGKEGAI